MRKIVWILYFLTLPAFAQTYTLVWCPVNPGPAYLAGAAYDVCVGSTLTTCDLLFERAWDTTDSITLPDTSNALIRVRAVALTKNLYLAQSAYSNPVQIIAGLTPPAIGGCP